MSGPLSGLRERWFLIVFFFLIQKNEKPQLKSVAAKISRAISVPEYKAYGFYFDDYEIIFTSNKKNRSLINSYSKNKNLKIQRIGKILKKYQDSYILKGCRKFKINKNLGYTHQF